jgi:hypothetical protein
MEHPGQTSIARHFAARPDPRVERTTEHRLLDISRIALCAVVCGADSGVAIEAFGRAKAAWLRTCLALPAGIPAMILSAASLPCLTRRHSGGAFCPGRKPSPLAVPPAHRAVPRADGKT